MTLTPKTEIDWGLIDEPMYVPTDEELERLAELDARDRKEKRKLQRLQDCGRWSYYFDAHNGQRTAYAFKCKRFRECEKCRKERAYQESRNLKRVMFKKPMLAIRMTADGATKMLHKVKKENFVRYPQEKFDLIFIAKDHEKAKEIFNGANVDTKWMSSLNWEKIVNTPEGRNKSGRMHIPQSTKLEKEFAIITSQQLLSNAPRKVVESAMDEAIKQTSYYNPKDAEGVEKGLGKRMGCTKGILKQAGYLVDTYQRKQKLIIDNISWKNSYSITKNPESRIVPKVALDAERVPI